MRAGGSGGARGYGSEILPLNADWLFGASLGLGLGGVLDAQGRGGALLPIPRLPLAGFEFFAGAVTFGSPQPLAFVSPPVAVCIRQ